MEIVLGGAVMLLFIAYFFAYPKWRKWEIRRERQRGSGRSMTSGMVGTFDEVFHPNAYYANLEWEAQQELPVPSPDSDKLRPDLDSGHITIRL